MATGNPLWDIHNTLWSLLENHQDFTTDLVRTECRRKLTLDQTQFWKNAVNAGDLPEVAIIQVGTGPRDRTSSNMSELIVRWAVLVSTGKQSGNKLFDIQWVILRALMGWDDAMKALLWEGYDFVKNCELISTEEAIDNEKLNRGLTGWSSVWAGETWCAFPHDKLVSLGT